jgi:hypothetical protein
MRESAGRKMGLALIAVCLAANMIAPAKAASDSIDLTDACEKFKDPDIKTCEDVSHGYQQSNPPPTRPQELAKYSAGLILKVCTASGAKKVYWSSPNHDPVFDCYAKAMQLVPDSQINQFYDQCRNDHFDRPRQRVCFEQDLAVLQNMKSQQSPSPTLIVIPASSPISSSNSSGPDELTQCRRQLQTVQDLLKNYSPRMTGEQAKKELNELVDALKIGAR